MANTLSKASAVVAESIFFIGTASGNLVAISTIVRIYL